jgi:hypothetical protein
MIVDTEKIISDTLSVFNKSKAQEKKFLEITSYISDEDYKNIHKSFLTPTNIKIDCDKFLKEIKIYDCHFEQWGTQHTHLPRYGLALVNQDGELKKQDPVNGSLYEWNVKFPENPIIETDCRVPTEILQLSSLQPLSIFNRHWCRSNILKWLSTAEFKPHIDTILPSPWIRMWGTTDSDNLNIRYANRQGELLKVENIERGRIYIIDTSIVHDACCYNKEVYQFFLSTLPSAISILKSIIYE